MSATVRVCALARTNRLNNDLRVGELIELVCERQSYFAGMASFRRRIDWDF